MIARRSTLEQAGWALFDVLGRNVDCLHRMPCAEALLRLMDCDQYQAVDLGGTHDQVPANLRKLCRYLEKRIGPHPDLTVC